MPLLHRKPFVPVEYPMDLKENDEVFVCLSTKEIFKDYDDFCERIILCNSLVWSCSLTGRSHLTYQEAAASEEKVKKLLKCFPMELREPVLYLSSICERRSLVELAEDVFMFVKDRYFIGEPVEVQFPEGEVACEIISVIPPAERELASLKGHKDKEDKYFPPAFSYKYEVERLDTSEQLTVDASNVARKKSAYTKDKNRLYIKQFVHNDQGIWKLKESTNVKYGISKIKFSHMFCGDPPDMNPKKPVKLRNAAPDKQKKQETLNKYFKASAKKMGMSPRKSPKKADVSATDLKKRRRRRSKKEIEEDKAKAEALKKELKKKKLAVSRARYNEFVRQWNMKREDLECEDLKELPMTHPVECGIPNEHFGDVAMFMEFLEAFKKILHLKDFFPHGVTFEVMERCLTVKEVAGPLSDLLQLLLVRIFGLLEGELEEIKQTDVKYTAVVMDRGDPSMKGLTKLAAKTDLWIRRHHGVPLGQLQLDTSTISEMLRLHLLTSGSTSEGKEAKWRYQVRGGYCNTDDPGMQFRVDHPDVLSKLGSQSVFELETAEKIGILKCLMNQILTYSATRDLIEEGCDKAKQLKVELRALQAEQTRKEKEEAIRLKDLKKAGASGERNDDKQEEEEKKERELRSGIINEKKKNIQALGSEIKEALRSAQMAPLGMDRAYRRYWLFTSIPGVFVEDCDEYKGPCLPKCTPSTAFAHDGQDALAYIKMLFKESCNKENISDTPENLVSPSPKKLLAERNGETTPVARTRTKSETASLLPLTCWADPDNCPVHGPNNRPVWSFIKDTNELDRLIQSLNKRGFRERKLREALLVEKDKMVKVLEKFQLHWFSPVDDSYEINANEKLQSKKIMRNYDNANLGHPEGTPLEEIIEGSLRDLILETEEKISAGALGCLKVKDRELWRNAIQDNRYDKQCKQITYGCKIRESEEVDDEEMDVDEDDEDGSRCSSPSLEAKSSGTRVFAKGFDPPPQRQNIQDLASAIVQVEQSIELKFLKKPLGAPANKEKTSRANTNPAMERWEQAVMESTNFAQLFLHFSTLENSVLWARSALNAFCRICRRRGDPQKMLLCDQCNKGHHMYCLKPKLTKIPSGDWFCPSCKRKETPVTSRRARKMFTEQSEDEDEEEEEEEEEYKMCCTCNAAGAELLCETCDAKYHLSCVNPPVRKVPKTSWYCHDCRAQNSVLPSKKEEATGRSSTPPAEEEVEDVAKPAKRPKKETPPEKPKVKEADKPKKEEPPRNSSTRNRSERRSLVNGREPNDGVWEPLRNPNGHVEEGDRLSRRKCSQAATAKISYVAKQLRSSQWAENGEVDENEFQDEARSRRSRRSLETTRTQKARDLPLDNASLHEILQTLMHHKDAWPFLRPVSKSEVPDYHQIIKKPMDFATIKHKLNMAEYTKNSELIADTELLFDNCYLYNQEGSEVYKAGETLRDLFHQLCAEHNIQVQLNGDSPQEPPTKKSRTVL